MKDKIKTNKASNGRHVTVSVDRLVIRMRICIVKVCCLMFLPKELWVGKHFGIYTQKWGVTLGKLDDRGVMQGLTDREASL